MKPAAWAASAQHPRGPGSPTPGGTYHSRRLLLQGCVPRRRPDATRPFLHGSPRLAPISSPAPPSATQPGFQKYLWGKFAAPTLPHTLLCSGSPLDPGSLGPCRPALPLGHRCRPPPLLSGTQPSKRHPQNGIGYTAVHLGGPKEVWSLRGSQQARPHWPGLGSSFPAPLVSALSSGCSVIVLARRRPQ